MIARLLAAASDDGFTGVSAFRSLAGAAAPALPVTALESTSSFKRSDTGAGSLGVTIGGTGSGEMSVGFGGGVGAGLALSSARPKPVQCSTYELSDGSGNDFSCTAKNSNVPAIKNKASVPP